MPRAAKGEGRFPQRLKSSEAPIKQAHGAITIVFEPTAKLEAHPIEVKFLQAEYSQRLLIDRWRQSLISHGRVIPMHSPKTKAASEWPDALLVEYSAVNKQAIVERRANFCSFQLLMLMLGIVH